LETFLTVELNVSPFEKVFGRIEQHRNRALNKLLNGIYVTKDIAANRPTKLFNGHSGTKVRTASFANASGK